MPNGPEGYQPSEDEIKSAEEHMTERESIVSEAREEAHNVVEHFRDEDRKNYTITWSDANFANMRKSDPEGAQQLKDSVEQRARRMIKESGISPRTVEIRSKFIKGEDFSNSFGGRTSDRNERSLHVVDEHGEAHMLGKL
ncbi:MAG: hypothetical protein NTY30_01175 [Candidatus Berkelbacteria bacterium]|nr:hypothetical protein [Candidatus Berkelbacteria bacterium]